METRPFSRRIYKSGMRWCLLRWTDVDPLDDGQIYLTRLHIFQTPWCSLMLHWLRLPDPQPDLHDHPNDFVSIVLSGGYEEIRRSKRGSLRTRHIRSFNIVRAEDQHKIISVRERTLTLVLANKVRRQWGFWKDGKFIEWREYKKTIT